MSLKLVKEMEQKLQDMESKLDEFAERKGKVVPQVSFQRDAKMERKAGDLYLLSAITGKDASTFSRFSDVTTYAERAAIVPTDLADWLKEQFVDQLWEDMELMADVPQFFPHYTIPNGTKTLSIPQKTDKSKAYLIQPAAEAIESIIGDSKVSFVAKRLIVLVTAADEADDETVVALLNLIRQDMIAQLAVGMENAILNGDSDFTTGINGNVGATDQLALWDGLRKIAKTDGGEMDFGGSLKYSQFLDLRRTMGKDSIKQDNLVFIVSPSTYHRMLVFPELITVDKYGAKATVVTGEVAKVGAIPVVVSSLMSEKLTAAGIEDAAGDKTCVILVNKSMFGLASRKSVTVEQDRNIVSSVNLQTAFVDVDFKKLSTTTTAVAVGINVPV